ncbi:MAG: hypothetical protein ACFB2W_03845 [Leptolyngbyaceae cyanobacterium]
MMLKALILATTMSLSVLPAQAAFTDFSDLTAGDNFFGPIGGPNNTITSSAIAFTIINAADATEDGRITVENGTFARDPVSGNHLFFQNRVGVAVDLLPGTESLSFSFNSNYGNVTLAVNDESLFAGSDLVKLDGTTIGDALVSIDLFGSSGPFTQFGTLMLEGDINDFSITGTEFAFDNFRAESNDSATPSVPEPGTAGIPLMAMGGLMLLYRRLV